MTNLTVRWIIGERNDEMRAVCDIDDARIKTVRDALAGIIPAFAWGTDQRGREVIDFGGGIGYSGISVEIVQIAREILGALDIPDTT